jgi:hypothetical protein
VENSSAIAKMLDYRRVYVGIFKRELNHMRSLFFNQLTFEGYAILKS